ncbi:MAG: glycosyl hydrolase [Flavobacteriia bacterium]|nr:glycosyl hydrolase [Flavobacteriia bacterium]
MKNILVFIVCLSLFNSIVSAQKNQAIVPKNPEIDNSLTDGLSFRLVGPALTSGRIVDLAVHPSNQNVWYVAAASGGVWKTTNHGTSFSPIFDNYGSFSVACVELAPSNPSTVWVGSGENNNQRAVSYGDGVYKSLDGGKSFTNMGLKLSEHIGNIIIHPTDENTVWVAAYGPVWSKGGERGVYKTTDGGKTWERTLFISDETGVSEIAIDPKNPSILYAATHQRRRHEWTYVGGGPESTIYKSIDGGKTWREINAGLPKGEMGRIGISVSPVDENYIYAIIEGKNDKGGFFRSTNKGESWSKMSGFSTSGNYYQEIICDNSNKDKVFVMDTWLHHTVDGGKTIVATGEDKKHVDNHCIWINPNDSDHWLVGCDGGLYETFNHAKDWKYFANLPIIQFYKVATDNKAPFYNIYGGTQDNNSMGGPSATINNAGILNSDWYITNGGDGFESAIDPTDPTVAYAESQYGGLVRYNTITGEKVTIQPLPGKNEVGYRWNWDAPLLISPHDSKTIYFAANKVFKSTNKGDDWKTISPDLTQQIDRNKLKVMGQVWSMDAVMKNASTTIYGNIIALDESPKMKGLLYAGTDDGCIQVSENDGATWTKYTTFTNVPSNTRVNMISTSLHDQNVAFAVFNNHRSGDFKPYLFKTSDKGKTWVSISGNLPVRGSVYCVRQDFIDPNLLFVYLFPVKEALLYVPSAPLGLTGTGSQGADLWSAENPVFGATFSIYIKEIEKSLKEKRQETEQKLESEKKDVFYPTFDEIRKEEHEEAAKLIWIIKDKSNKEIKRLLTAPSKGISRINWNLRTETTSAIKISKSTPGRYESADDGFLVSEGEYTVEVYLLNNGVSEKIIEPTKFKVKSLFPAMSTPQMNEELANFRKDVSELKRNLAGSEKLMEETEQKLELINYALINYPNAPLKLIEQTKVIQQKIEECAIMLYGDPVVMHREFETPPSILNRFGTVEYQLFETTTSVTNTQRNNIAITKEELTIFRAKLNEQIQIIEQIEKQLQEIQLPYIKGADQNWKAD